MEKQEYNPKIFCINERQKQLVLDFYAALQKNWKPDVETMFQVIAPDLQHCLSCTLRTCVCVVGVQGE